MTEDCQRSTDDCGLPTNGCRLSTKVSVIICCYTMERLKDISQTVESVLGQSVKPHEVILSVDHNEWLYQTLRFRFRDAEYGTPDKPLRLVHNTGISGISATRNLGIHTAIGDLIAFIDDDATAEKNWLAILVRSLLRNRSAAVVGGKCILVWPEDKRRPVWFAEELDWLVGGTHKGMHVLPGGEVRNVSGCNMVAIKEDLEKVGLFSTRIGAVAGYLRGAEEAELCLRLAEALPDKVVLYDAEAIVQHKVHRYRVSLKYLASRSFQEGFSKAKLEKLLRIEKALASESYYLRYLLLTSIPQRLRYFYKKGSLPQAGAIIISIAATGAGYVRGKVRHQRSGE